MANTITNLTTSNTFLQWLTASQSVISSLNSLREGGVANTYVVNTSIEIAGDLVVSGNLTLDAIGYDDLNVAGNTQIDGTLTVGGNTSLSNVYVTYGNFETSNVTIMVGDANTAVYSNITAVSGFASAAGSYANSAFIHANSSYESQNTTGVYANSSYDHANSAFNAANTAAADSLAFAIALG
jgi:hypothetical protein